MKKTISVLVLCCAASLAQDPRVSIAGRVLLDTGGPPPQPAVIEEVCKVTPQPQGKTDADGYFTVLLGFRPQDSYSSAAATSESVKGVHSESADRQGIDVDPLGARFSQLNGCVLRASLTGYWSEVRDISRVRAEDNANIGTITLHKGAANSTTTLAPQTPKGAQTSLDKGRTKLAEHKPAEAEAEFRKAVQQFPKFGDAWYELGSVLEDQKKDGEAHDAYASAVEADPASTKALLSLSRLAMARQNWQEAADRSGALLALDARSFPEAFYYNAFALMNLKKNEPALASAELAVKLDPAHKTADAERLYGTLLALKGDYPAAAEQLKNYLAHAGASPNAAGAKDLLSQVEQRIATKGNTK